RIEIASRELHLFFDVFRRASAVADASARPPSHDRIVVVSACICHAMTLVIMGLEVRRLWVFAESKLQDRHTREPKASAQAFHFRGNHAKILRKDGQAA